MSLPKYQANLEVFLIVTAGMGGVTIIQWVEDKDATSIL